MKKEFYLENITINIALVKDVANALKELKEIMVFVGGATISLYTDDPAAQEIRPTSDIDMTVKLVPNYASWVKMNERLLELGFSPNPEGHSICSYKYNNINVDIMPSEDGHMGQANKWFKIGFKNLQKVSIDEEEIQILSAPCFLATKFEAFNGRGKDYRTSHDFEDIIYVIDNRTTIIEEIKTDDKEIREYLKSELSKIINMTNTFEILSCHLHPFILEDRYPILESKIQGIINLE